MQKHRGEERNGPQPGRHDAIKVNEIIARIGVEREFEEKHQRAGHDQQRGDDGRAERRPVVSQREHSARAGLSIGEFERVGNGHLLDASIAKGPVEEVSGPGASIGRSG
jgi:hypothetical protein